MGTYIALVLKGIFTSAHWKACGQTLADLIQNPGSFYSGIGKKETDDRAYVLGITASLVVLVLTALMMGGTFGKMWGVNGLAALPVALVVSFVLFFVGVYVTYYIGAWILNLAVTWVIGASAVEKIRPILFSTSVAGLAGILPVVGGLVSIAVTCVLLVIAYETNFKCTRGKAIGAALLGVAIPIVLIMLVGGLVGGIFALGMAGMHR